MGKRRLNKIMMLALAIFMATASFTFAFDENNFEVANGSAQVSRNDNTVTFNATNNTILNFNSFNIQKEETVVFNLPQSTDKILTRVTGNEPTTIFGKLICPGEFFHVNENGIHVGANANINVASLVLSTRDITNSDFLSGNYQFQKMSDKKLDMLLLNEGRIKIGTGGFGILIAGAIENNGAIIAPAGTIVLATGRAVKIGVADRGRISIAITEEQAETVLDFDGKPITTQISNSGTLEAGAIALRADSVTDIFEKAINLEGFVKATSCEITDSGTVRITASGDVTVNADIEAENVEITSDKGDIIIASPLEITKNVVLKALEGQIINIEDSYIETEKLMAESTHFDVVSKANTSIITKVNDNINIEQLIETVNDLVTIKGVDLGEVAYIATSNITLEAPRGDINTVQGIFIPGNTVKLSAQKFGSKDNPVGVSANITYINRIQGDIDISEMWGMGSSITIRGPAPAEGDPWGAVTYNSDSHLVLNAENVTSNSSLPIYMYGNITFFNFNCTVPDKEIYFQPGKNYIFKENLNIVGSTDVGMEEYLIKLRSHEEGNPWFLDVQAETPELDYLNVSDCYSKEDLFVPIGIDGRGNTNIEIDPVWDGSGNNNWNYRWNWIGNQVPTGTQSVTFNSSSGVGDICYINDVGTWSGGSFTIESTYDGTIYLSGADIIVSDFSQAGGNFTGHTYGRNMTVTGDFTITGGSFTSTSGTLTLQGAVSIAAGTFTHNSGTVEYDVTGDYTFAGGGETFNNLIINKLAGDANYTITFAEDFVVAGDLTVKNEHDNASYRYTIVGSGDPTITVNNDLLFPNTVAAGEVYFGEAGNNFTAQVGGDITKSDAGVHTASSVEIIGSGTSVISGGDMEYGDFTCAAAGKDIQFEAGTTHTVNGEFTITGAMNQRINLHSTAAGSWDLSVGSFSVDYADIEYSHASANIDCTRSIDGGNNVNWDFLTYYWTGAASSSWNNAANWAHTSAGAGGFGVPGAGDNVLFDSGSLNDCNIDIVNLTIKELTIETSFPDTIYMNGNDFNVTNYYILAGGTFNNAAGEIVTVTGDFTKTGGTFASAGEVVFNSTGTQSLTSGGISFYDLTHSGTGTLEIEDALTVTNTLSNTAGIIDLNGNDLTMTGASPFDNTALLKLIGSQTITDFVNDLDSGLIEYYGTGNYPTLAAGDAYVNMLISGSGTYTQSADVVVTGTLTLDDGVLYAAGNGVTVNTLENNATLRLDGDEAVTITNMDTNSGLVEYFGSGTYTGLVALYEYYDMAVTGTGEFIQTDDLVVNNTLTLDNGTLYVAENSVSAGTFNNNATLKLDGGEDLTALPKDTNSGTVLYIGEAAVPSYTSYNYGDTFYNLTLSSFDGSHTWAPASMITVNNNLSLTNGTFDISALNDINFSIRNLLISGGEFILPTGRIFVVDDLAINRTGGTFTHSNGTVEVLAHEDYTFSATGVGFYDLTFNKTRSFDHFVTIAGDFPVAHDLVVKNEDNDFYGYQVYATGTPTITVSGNMSFPDTPTANGWVWFGETQPLENFTVDLSGNLDISDPSVYLYCNIDFTNTSSRQTVSHTAGTLSSGTWTVDKTAQTLLLNSNVTFSGLYNANLTLTSGTIDLDTYTFTITGDYTQTAGTLTATNGNITVGDAFTLSGGTFDAPSGTLSIGSDVNFAGGTYIHNNGTVVFYGHDVFTVETGGASFYNVIFNRTDNTVDYENNIMIIDGFTVLGNLEVKNESDKNYIVTGRGNPEMVVYGDISFPDTPGFAGTCGFGSLTETVYVKAAGGASQSLSHTASDTYVYSRITVDKTGGSLALASDVYLRGDLIITNGTLDPSIYVVYFDRESGTQEFDPGGISFPDIVQSGAAETVLSSALVVTGSLTLSDGKFNINDTGLTMTGATFDNQATLKFLGNETLVNFSNDLDSGIVEYAGSGTYTGLVGHYDYYNMTVSGSGEYILNNLATNDLDVADALSLTGGILSANGHILRAGSFSNDATLRLLCSATEDLSNLPKDSDSGTVEYVGEPGVNLYSAFNYLSNFYNLKINSTEGNDTWQPTVMLTVNGTLDLDSGALDISLITGGTLNLGWYDQSNGTFTAGANNVTLATPSSSDPLFGSFTLSGGTFNAPTGPVPQYTLTVANTVNISGGTFNNNSGKVIILGHKDSMTITSGGISFYDLEINRTEAADYYSFYRVRMYLLDDFTVANDLVFKQDYLQGNASYGQLYVYGTNGPTITVNNDVSVKTSAGSSLYLGLYTNSAYDFTLDIKGNYLMDKANSYVSADMIFSDSTGNQTFDQTAGYLYHNAITVNKESSAVFDLPNGIELLNSGSYYADFTFTSNDRTGILDLNDQDFLINGDFTLTTNVAMQNSTGAITVTGTYTQNDTAGFTSTTGTQDIALGSVVINAGSFDASAANALYITTSFTQTTGNFTCHDNAVSMTGNFSFTGGGTFKAPASSDLTVGGTFTVAGSSTFYTTTGTLIVKNSFDISAATFINYFLPAPPAPQVPVYFGTVRIDPQYDGMTFNSGSNDFYDLSFYRSSTAGSAAVNVYLQNSFTVLNELLLQNDYASYVVNVRGENTPTVTVTHDMTVENGDGAIRFIESNLNLLEDLYMNDEGSYINSPITFNTPGTTQTLYLTKGNLYGGITVNKNNANMVFDGGVRVNSGDLVINATGTVNVDCTNDGLYVGGSFTYDTSFSLVNLTDGDDQFQVRGTYTQSNPAGIKTGSGVVYLYETIITAGNFDASAGSSLTIYTDYTQSAGTFTCPDVALDIGYHYSVGADFTLSGGTFYAPATSDVYLFMKSNTSTLEKGDLVVSGGANFYSTAGTLTIEGNMDISGGTFHHRNGTVQIGSFESGNTLTVGASPFYNLTLNHLSRTGTHVYYIAGDVTVENDLVVKSDYYKYHRWYQNDPLTYFASAVGTNATITVKGNLTLPVVTKPDLNYVGYVYFGADNGNNNLINVEMTGDPARGIAGDVSLLDRDAYLYANVNLSNAAYSQTVDSDYPTQISLGNWSATKNSGTTVEFTNGLRVGGDLTFNAPAGGALLDCNGLFYVNGSFTYDNNFTLLDTDLNGTEFTVLGTYTQTNSTGVTVGTGGSICFGDVNIQAGHFDASGATASNVSIRGSYTQSGGTFTCPDVTIVTGDASSNEDFTLSGGTFNAPASADMTIENYGELLITGGTFNSTEGTLTVWNNVDLSGGKYNHGDGTLQVLAHRSEVTLNPGSNDLFNLICNRTTSGGVNAAYIIFSNNINVLNDFTFLTQYQTYYYYVIPQANSGYSLTVNGDFTVQDGGVTRDIYLGVNEAGKVLTMNLAGNFTNDYGTYFNPYIVLNLINSAKTTDFSGSTTFYNDSNSVANFNCTASGKEIFFEAGQTQTINCSVNIVGSQDSRIKLHSQTPASAWNVNIVSPANAFVDYADIRDSNSTTTVDCIRSYDATGNTNWDFDTYYWVGSNSVWEDANNWSHNPGGPGGDKGSYPGVGSNVLFDADGTNCTINGAINVGDFIAETTYTGTINIGANKLTTTGDLLITGGALTSSGTVEFNKATGTQTFDPGASTLTHITHINSAAVQLLRALTASTLTNSQGTFDLNGFNLTLTGGVGSLTNASSATFKLHGDETLTGYDNSNVDGTVEFSGSESYNGLITGYSYEYMKVSGTGTYTLLGHLSITGPAGNDGVLTLEAGTLYAAGKNITVNTLINNATLKLDNNETLTISTKDTDSGTIEYAGSSGPYASFNYGTAFYSLKISGNATYQPSSMPTMNGSLSVSDGVLDLSVGGDLSIQALTVSGGEFISTPGTLYVTDTTDLTGGTFTHNSGTIEFRSDDSSFSITSSGAAYNDVTFNKVGGLSDVNITIADDMSVAGSLSIKNELNTPDYSIIGSGNPTVTITQDISFPSTANSGLVYFGSTTDADNISIVLNRDFSMNDAGAYLYTPIEFTKADGDQAYTYTAGTIEYGTWTIKKNTGFTFTLNSDLTLGNGADLVFTAPSGTGTFDWGGNNLSIDGDFTYSTQFNMTNTGGNFYVGGTYTQTNAGTFTPGGSIDFGNFDQQAGTFDCTGSNPDIFVTGTFTVSGGTFISTSGILYVYQSVDFTGGSFTHSSGTFQLVCNYTNTTFTTGGGGFSFYDLSFTRYKAISSYIYLEDSFTVDHDLILKAENNSASYGTRVLSNNSPTITVTNNIDCPTNGYGAKILFGYDNTLTVNLDGDIVMNNNNAYIYCDVNLRNTGTTQTINQAAGVITTGTITVQKTGPAQLILTNGLVLDGGGNFVYESSAVTAGIFTIGGDINVDGDMTITYDAAAPGALDFGGNSLTVGGSFEYTDNFTISNVSGYSIGVADDGTVGGTYTHSNTGSFTPSGTIGFGNYAQEAGTFNAGSGDVNVEGAFTLSGGCAFKSTTATLSIGNGADFTGGTFTHNSGTVEIRGNNNCDLRANGTTFYDFVITRTNQTYVATTTYIYIYGDFTVNDLTIQNEVPVNSRHLIIYGSGDPTITVNGDLSFLDAGGNNQVYFGHPSYQITCDIKGNFLMDFGNAFMWANASFSKKTAPQIITQSTDPTTGALIGYIQYGTWTINKQSAVGDIKKAVFTNGFYSTHSLNMTFTSEGSAAASQIELGGDFTIGGNLVLTFDPSTTGTFDWAGYNVYIGGDFAYDTGFSMTNTTGNFTVYGTYTQSNPAGFTAASSADIKLNDVVITSGNFNCLNAASLDLRGSFTQTANTYTFTCPDTSVTIGSYYGGDFTLNAGTFIAPSTANITINRHESNQIGGSFYLNGGTFTSTQGRLQIEASADFSGGGFQHNKGTVVMNIQGLDTTHNTFTSGGTTFNDFVFTRTYYEPALKTYLYLQDDISVHNLTIENVLVNATQAYYFYVRSASGTTANITVAGDLSAPRLQADPEFANFGDSGTITVDLYGDLSILSPRLYFYPNVTFLDTAEPQTLEIDLTGGAGFYGSLIFNKGATTAVFNSDFTISGSLVVESDPANKTTIDFNDKNIDLDSTTSNFTYDSTFNLINTAGNFRVNGTYEQSNPAGFTCGNGTAISFRYFNLYGGPFDAANATSLTVYRDMVQTAGTFTVGDYDFTIGYDLTVSGANTVFNYFSDNTFTVRSLTLASGARFNTYDATLTMTGHFSMSGSGTEFNGPTTKNITIGQGFSATGGTFNSTEGTLAVTFNVTPTFDLRGCVFYHNDGTVKLWAYTSDVNVYTGGHTLYNLTTDKTNTGSYVNIIFNDNFTVYNDLKVNFTAATYTDHWLFLRGVDSTVEITVLGDLLFGTGAEATATANWGINQTNPLTILLAGNYSQATDNAYAAMRGNLTFIGEKLQTFAYTNGQFTYGTMKVNKTSGLVTLQNDIVNNTGDPDKIIDIEAGILYANGKTVESSNGFSNTGIFRVQGVEDLSGITKDTNSGRVEYVGDDGVTSDIDISTCYGLVYYTLRTNSRTTLDVFHSGGDLDINGDLELTEEGGTLDVDDKDIDLTGTCYNDAVLRTQGEANGNLFFTNFVNDTDSGTVEYDGSGTYAALVAGDDYFNILFSGTGQWSLDALCTINGTFVTQSGSSVSEGPYDIICKGDVTLADNTYAYGSADFRLEGDLTLNSGNNNMGHVIVGASPDTTTLASNLTAIDVTINGGDVLITDGYNVDLSDFMLINATGTLNATSGAGGDTTIYIGGNWDNDGTLTAGASTVVFDGTSAQTIYAGGTGASKDFNDVQIANTSADVTALTDAMEVSGTLNILANTKFVQSNSDLTAAIVTVQANGEWENHSDADITIGDNVANAGTIDFDGTTSPGGILIRSTSGGTQRNWQGAGAFNITDADVKDQTCLGGTPPYIQVLVGTDSGNNINWFFGNTITTIYGSLYQSIGGSKRAVAGISVKMGVNSGTSLSQGYTDAAGDYTLYWGGFTANDVAGLYVDDVTYEGSHITKVASAANRVLNLYENVVTLSQESGASALSNANLRTIEQNAVIPASDLLYTTDASNNVTITGTNILYQLGGTYTPAADVTVGGNVIINGTTNIDALTLLINNNADLIINGVLNLDNNSSLLNLSGDLDLNGALDLSGTSAGIQLDGDFDATGGAFTKGTGTLTFDGGVSQNFTSNSQDMGNIVLSGASTVVVLLDDLDANSITIGAGTQLDNSANHTIYVGGDWTNGGLYTYGTSTVIFDGASASNITGATTFYNLTCVTPSKTLKFKEGETFTINNTLNLNGQAAGTEIVLDSQDGATRFTFKVLVQPTVYYLNVSNSNVDDSGQSILARNSLDTLNNDTSPTPCWLFGGDIAGDVYSDRGITLVGAGVNIVLVVNGATINNINTDASGHYSFAGISITSGDCLLVYINDHATLTGNTVTVAQNPDIPDLDIYASTLIARHETIAPVTNALLNTAKGVLADTDIIYSVAGSALTTNAGSDLLVWSGKTFTPGGNVNIGGGLVNRGTISAGTNVFVFNGAGSYDCFSNASTLYDVEFNNTGGTWTLGDDLDIDHDLAITNGTLASGANTIYVARNWSATGGSLDAGTGTVVFDGAVGSASQIMGANTFYDLTCTTASKQLNFQAGVAQTITNDLTLTGGGTVATLIVLRSTAAGSRFRFQVSKPTTCTYLDVDDSEVIGISGNNIWAQNSVAGANTDRQTTSPFWVFDPSIMGIVYADDAKAPVGAGVTVTIYIEGGTTASTTTNASGRFSFQNLFIPVDDTIIFYVDNDATYKANLFTLGGGPSYFMHNIELYNSRVGIRSETATNMTNQLMNDVSSVFGDADVHVSIALPSYTTTIEDGLDLWVASVGANPQTYSPGANVICEGGLRNEGTINAGTDTFTFNGTGSFDIRANSSTLHDVVFNNAGGTWTLQDDLGVSGDFTVLAGAVSGAAGTTTSFTGAGSNNITMNSSSLYNVTFDNAAGTWVLQDDMDIDGSLTVTNGTFDPVTNSVTTSFTGTGSHNITTNSSSLYDVAFNNAAGTWTLQDALDIDGSLTVTNGTVDAGTNAVSFTGTGAHNITTNSSSLYDITFDNATGTWTLQDDLDVNGNFTITNGTVTSGANTINLAGNWTNNDTFNYAGGTIVFDTAGTTSTIYGSNTFNDFTCITPNKNLKFEAGTNQNITGTLDLNGQAGGTEIILTSTISGTRFSLQVASLTTCDYLSVKDSEVVGTPGNNIFARNSIDGGNTDAETVTPFWIFKPTIQGYVYANDEVTPVGNVIVRLYVYDAGVKVIDKQTTTDAVTGQFTFDNTFILEGNTILFFVDDVASQANLFTIGAGANHYMQDVYLYETRVGLRHETAGPMTNAVLYEARSDFSNTNIHLSMDASHNATFEDGLDLWIASGETYTPGANVICEGGLNTDGTINAGTNSFTFNGAGTFDISSNSSSLYDVTFNNAGGTWTLQDNFDADNDLTITGGNLACGAHTVNIGGTFDNNDTFTTSGSFIFDSTSAETVEVGTSSFNNVTFNGTGGSWTLQTDDVTSNGLLTITDGELIQAGIDLTVADVSVGTQGTWTNNSDGDVTIGGSVTNNGTITFDGLTGDGILIRSTVGGTQRNWQGTGTFSMTDVDVQDQTCIGGTPPYIPVTSGTDSGNNINWFFGGVTIVTGSVYDSVGGAKVAQAGINIVLAVNNNIQLFTATTDANGDYVIPVNAFVSGDVVSLYLNDAAYLGSLVTRTFDGSNLTLNLYHNNVTARSETGASALDNTDLNTIQNNPSVAAAKLLYTIDGTGNLSINNPYDLYVQSGTFTPGADVTLGNSVRMDGTLNMASDTLTVSGDFNNQGGFSSTGLVEFVDPLITSNISGSTTFNDLTCEAAGKTIVFQSGATQTVNGAFTLKGASGNDLSLDCSIPGTYSYLMQSGTYFVDYLNVTDNNNLGPTIYNDNSTYVRTINWDRKTTAIYPPPIDDPNPDDDPTDDWWDHVVGYYDPREEFIKVASEVGPAKELSLDDDLCDCIFVPFWQTKGMKDFGLDRKTTFWDDKEERYLKRYLPRKYRTLVDFMPDGSIKMYFASRYALMR